MNDPFQHENDLTEKSVKLSPEHGYSQQGKSRDGLRGPHYRIDDPIVDQSEHVDHQHLAQQEKERLQQASQIADHLRTQFEEIARREGNLNKQLSMLDKERRSIRMWMEQIEAEFTERDELLKQRDNDLNEKLDYCKNLVQQINEGNHHSPNELTSHENHQVQASRIPELEQYSRLEQENLRLRKQLHDLDKIHHSNLHELKEELEKDQEKLIAEIENLKQVHQAEKQKWVHDHGDLEYEKDLYSKAIARSQQELDGLLKSQTDQLTEQQKELQSATEEFALERENLCDQLESSHQEKTSLNEKLTELEEKLEEALLENEILKEDLTNSRNSLEEAKAELEKVPETVNELSVEEFEKKQADFQKREAVFENRMRFQTAHLEKARDELQSMQNELKLEKQKLTQFFESRQSLNQKLKANLIRFRNSLDTREKLLDSSRRTMHDELHTLKHDLALEKQKLDNQKTLWNQQRDVEQLEISSLKEAIHVKNELLEKQKHRLDQLKKELDETSRDQMEARFILDRLQAEIHENLTDEDYQIRYDAARTLIQESFLKTKEEIEFQQDELLNGQKELEDKNQSLDLERQQLKLWIEKQKDLLRDWEEKLVSQTAKALESDSQSREKKEKWAVEKREAEDIIRGLLKQIEDMELETLDQPLDEPEENEQSKAA